MCNLPINDFLQVFHNFAEIGSVLWFEAPAHTHQLIGLISTILGHKIRQLQITTNTYNGRYIRYLVQDRVQFGNQHNYTTNAFDWVLLEFCTCNWQTEHDMEMKFTLKLTLLTESQKA